MRTITVRQLSINLFNELKDLPVTVTRYGKPLCVITPAKEGEGVSTGPISKGGTKGTPTPSAKPLQGKDFEKPRGELNMEDYL